MNKIYVIGIGPGSFDHTTLRAVNALKECDVITGYTLYADLVRKNFPDKEYVTTPMRRETERCRMAFEEAAKGKTVAMVCSGDAGVYGMAGLIYEIGASYPETEIEVIPGVTAALSGAAVLGAPLIHDFCLISLSDLMTPWETIAKRLKAAAEADFVICLYNPASHKRADYMKRACMIIRPYRSAENVCAVVRSIGREGEAFEIMTLAGLENAQADMFSTVYIGNSSTKVINGKMVTPRGYRNV